MVVKSKITTYAINICFFDKKASILPTISLLKIISITVKNVYKKIAIKRGIDKTLYTIACLKFNSKMQINPLVSPHPKQEIPKTFFITQSDMPNFLVIKYKTQKKIVPIPNEYKEYLLFIILFFILHQRLTITVSKSA